MPKTLYLPGASGGGSFWKPVAGRVQLDGVIFAWPGLGDEPTHPDVNSIDDLTNWVAKEITGPVNIIAQSMGGAVALKLALKLPLRINRLVLVATSGGVSITDLGGTDWRPAYFEAFPRAAAWIADPVADLSSEIPSIEAPTLLLWGDADPISPVAVGQRLAGLLPNARLRIFHGADHDLVQTHADAVAAEVRSHLAPASMGSATGG